MNNKPTVKLTETDGNVFAIISEVTRALRKSNREIAAEFQTKAFQQNSYDDVLTLCMEYVEIL